MKEIRWHGRGGDGAFTAARLLGLAASVYGGYYGQAFPSFGPERRGAPVLSFNRIDDKPINDHSQITECDCVIVLDETLIDTVDFTKGLKQEGYLVINSAKGKDEWHKNIKFAAINNLILLDGTKMALEILGVPIVSTVMLGAAMAATDMVSLEDLKRAIDFQMAPKVAEKNKKAIEAAYNLVKEAI